MTTALEDAPPLISDVIPGADDDAPYGRFGNGKARKTPPKGVAGPKKLRAAGKAKGTTDYRPGVRGFAQIGAFIASFFSPLDAVTIGDHTEPIAEAIQVTADNDIRFAAVMDKILSKGPYAALFAAATPMVVQMLHNHDIVPSTVATAMGGRTKQSIIDELTADRVSSDAVYTN